MNNKITMVNKELHMRLFEQDDRDEPELEQAQEREINYRRQQLPPQLVLKNMIKKGLANTQPIKCRPRTALSSFKRTSEGRHTISRLKIIEGSHREKTPYLKRHELVSQNAVEFYFNTTHPQQLEEVGLILSKMKGEREQEASRKQVKLDKYGEKKFRYAWKKSNIPE